MSCLQYLANRNDVIVKAAQQRPLIRLADKNLNPIVAVTEEMSANWEEKWDDSVGEDHHPLREPHRRLAGQSNSSR